MVTMLTTMTIKTTRVTAFNHIGYSAKDRSLSGLGTAFHLATFDIPRNNNECLRVNKASTPDVSLDIRPTYLASRDRTAVSTNSCT